MPIFSIPIPGSMRGVTVAEEFKAKDRNCSFGNFNSLLDKDRKEWSKLAEDMREIDTHELQEERDRLRVIFDDERKGGQREDWLRLRAIEAHLIARRGGA